MRIQKLTALTLTYTHTHTCCSGLLPLNKPILLAFRNTAGLEAFDKFFRLRKERNTHVIMVEGKRTDSKDDLFTRMEQQSVALGVCY